jgi:hypothetical protein
LRLSRESRELLFTLVLLIVVGLAVLEAQKWQLRAALFPRAIGLPLLGLLVALLVVQAVRWRRRRQAAAAAPGGGVEVDLSGSHRRLLAISGWLLGFFGLIWALGFPLGGTLGTLAYLKLSARERWPISLAFTGGTVLLFVLMINGLRTPFPRGTLFEMISPG